MSVIGSNILAGASGQGGEYTLTRSLRFRSSASAYLNRTPASAGNRKTWTWASWVKRGSLGANQSLFSGGDTIDSDAWIRFDSGDTLNFSNITSNSYTAQVTTSAVFRDPSAWYHVVVVIDTTQATGSNRVKIYVNGVQQTVTFTTTPSQNTDMSINLASLHRIAVLNYAATQYFDGYMAEQYFIDGQALTPSSFGETSSTTGVWQPIEYTGTYGTNGFYLPFTDNSALTSGSNAGLGKDFSGNGNYWTTNNISITSGATYDSMTDVPTLTSATAANFATLNPLTQTLTNEPTKTITNGNLTLTTTQANGNIGTAFSTIAVTSGKYYCEYYVSNIGGANSLGFINFDSLKLIDCASWGIATPSDGYIRGGSVIANNSSTVVTGLTTITTGSLVMLAIDFDSGKFWTGVDGTWDSSGNPSAGTNQIYTFTPSGKSWVIGVNSWTSSGTVSGSINFGQRPFAYTPPTGFVALNTYNLPTPTIGATASSQANKYFDAQLWTGNGSSQTLTTAGSFSPDFVWIKSRSGANSHFLTDTVRGATKTLFSNSTGAEATETQGLTAFTSTGFTVGSDASVNSNGSSYVGWAWDANGSGSSNTAGSITSTVSANTTSGFSIVTYTGNGSAGATVGHGLGVTPSMLIVKHRNSGIAHDWRVYHSALGNTKNLQLNLTDAAQTTSATWNNTSPSSTVFTLGSGGATNESGTNFVAYCFSEVAGFSKFTSYTGNGSSDGPFIHVGFRPAFVMIKSSSSGENWIIYDNRRLGYNLTDKLLFPNTSGAEETSNGIDILSNGFKLRASTSGSNANGGTYIVMAFAENPYKYSLAR